MKKLLNSLILVVFLLSNSNLALYAKYNHKAKKTKHVKATSQLSNNKSNTKITHNLKLSATPQSAYEKALQAKAIKPKLVIPNNPNDAQITNLRIFSEPLIPMAASKAQKALNSENSSLAQAITQYENGNNKYDLNALTKFLNKYPNSRWAAALNLNMGLLYFNSGYLSLALKSFESAWQLSKGQTKAPQSNISESAISHLLKLEARLGRLNEIKTQLAQIKKMPMHGSNEARIYEVKQGLYAMEHTPQVAYKCGPYAVGSLYLLNHKLLPLKIKQVKSTSNGTNFKQIKDLANSLGMKYQVAKKTPQAQFIVPSIMHWKLGHFAAITKKLDDRYVIKDPTFDDNGTISATQKALESQSDGYFLIPSNNNQLPKGWVAVSDAEAAKIWGKGNAGAAAQNKNPGTPQQCPNSGDCGGCNGMPKPMAWSAQAELNIADTPLFYNPTIGPAMAFRLNYNQNEGNQQSNNIRYCHLHCLHK